VEWPVISGESTATVFLFTGYVIPLAVLAVLVNFIRMTVIGVSLPFGGTIRSPLSAGLTNAVLTCVMAVLGVALIALIINLLAPTFGGSRDGRRALQSSAYSLTAAYVGTFLGLLPMGGLLSFIAGLYGIYTLYLGLPVMMRSRPDKAVGYTAAVVICTVLVGLILGAVGASVGIGRTAGLGAFSRSADREAQREQAAATVGNVIGGILGTDGKGKEGLSAAISNLAKTGEQMEQQEKRNGASSRQSGGASSDSQPADASPANPAQAMAAAGGLMSAFGAALGGQHRHTPVDFHQLEQLLPPALPGMTRQHASGAADQALGVKKTSATATYRGTGNAHAEVQIADDTGVSGLMDVAESIDVNGTTESDTGFEKDVSLGGHKVHEKYDRSARHGEVSTIVARRFGVQVTGDDVTIEDLERSLSAIDLKALESMQDAGAMSQ